MKFIEIIEQLSTIGTTTNPSTIGIQPNLSGNVAALQDPKLQAAQLAQVQKQKDEQKKNIQDEITRLQDQIRDLQTQMADLNKSV